MILYEVPGRKNLEIENIVFDYNGTIAVDGTLIEGVELLINKLSENANIYVLTADTYGTVEEQCKNIKAKVLTFPKENAGIFKRDIVENLSPIKTICLGNGYNDIAMFKISALSIGILEGEGINGELILNSDILCRSIFDALNILLNENRVKATLRN